MIDNVTFGGFVRTLRKEKQMTQLELAKILNLSDKTISKWEQGKAFPDIAVWEALAEALDVTVAELFAGEKLPKEEGKVSAAVFEDGIAVAANEVRQKKKRYRGLLMIMAALLVVVAGLGIGKSLKEKFAVYMVRMDATILEVHEDYWEVRGKVTDAKGRSGVYDISLTEPWYLEHPVDGKEGDEIRFFYREDWKNRTLKENEYIQGIFSMEKVEDE